MNGLFYYAKRKLINYLLEKLSHLKQSLDRDCSTDSLSKKNQIILNNNENLKKVKSDDDVYILATGPSLKKLDLTSLIGKDCISVNGFFKHKLFTDINPRVHCLMDPNLFDRSVYTEGSFYQELISKSKDTKLLVPLFRGKKFIEQFKINQKIDTFCFMHGSQNKNCYSLKSPIPAYYGIGALAINVAIYLNYKRIFLLGFDHTWLAERGDENQSHFYQGATIDNKKWGNLGKLSDRVPYVEELRTNYILWNDYIALKNIADSKGIKIINLTDPTFLDVFPKGQINNFI